MNNKPNWLPHSPAIAPSLLAADWTRLHDELAQLESSGAELLHLDVMDGHFVPPITFGAQLVSAVKPHTSLMLDVHLMVSDPDSQIDQFVAAGAAIISVHVEAAPHIHRTVERIHAAGIRAGVAINPGTSLSALEGILPYADLILLMTVNPGWGGQAFIPGSVERIKQLADMREKHGLSYAIELDGGISSAVSTKCIAAGADILVAGTSVFKFRPEAQGGAGGGYKAAVEALRK